METAPHVGGHSLAACRVQSLRYPAHAAADTELECYSVGSLFGRHLLGSVDRANIDRRRSIADSGVLVVDCSSVRLCLVDHDDVELLVLAHSF